MTRRRGHALAFGFAGALVLPKPGGTGNIPNAFVVGVQLGVTF